MRASTISSPSEPLTISGNPRGVSSRISEVTGAGAASSVGTTGAAGQLSTGQRGEFRVIAHMAACVRLSTRILRKMFLT
jgi:hypothetical protein